MNVRFVAAGMLGGIVAAIATAAFFGVASARDDDSDVIVEATSGSMTATTGTIFDASCNISLDYDAEVIDLNGDGQPEVFTQIYGTCLGGSAGVSLDLYIKDRNGRWNSQFGFPGVYSVLESKNMDYPDIEIGGPGSCFPVWRWGGERYQLFQTCEP
jgi:hypothetical protein